MENCNLAFLTRDDVVKVATDYPTMEVRLRNLATRRAKKDDKLLKELIAEKQKKEEDALMQQLAAVSGAAVAFAGRIEMSADEMELYEAALKIQKVVRGHQARASAAGKIRKMLIQSVLTVDAMSEGITAVLLTSEDGAHHATTPLAGPGPYRDSVLNVGDRLRGSGFPTGGGRAEHRALEPRDGQGGEPPLAS